MALGRHKGRRGGLGSRGRLARVHPLLACIDDSTPSKHSLVVMFFFNALIQSVCLFFFFFLLEWGSDFGPSSIPLPAFLPFTPAKNKTGAKEKGGDETKKKDGNENTKGGEKNIQLESHKSVSHPLPLPPLFLFLARVASRDLEGVILSSPPLSLPPSLQFSITFSLDRSIPGDAP